MDKKWWDWMCAGVFGVLLGSVGGLGLGDWRWWALMAAYTIGVIVAGIDREIIRYKEGD